MPIALFSAVIIMTNMGNTPDWIFYRHDGPTEADVMPRLVAEFPGFRPRWEKHLEFWEGKPAGNYNDITQFVYFVVRDLYPSGKIEEVQHAFDLMEHWLKNGNKGVQELVVIGFLEDLQISHQGRGSPKRHSSRSLGPSRVRHGMNLRDFGVAKATFDEVVLPTQQLS